MMGKVGFITDIDTIMAFLDQRVASLDKRLTETEKDIESLKGKIDKEIKTEVIKKNRRNNPQSIIGMYCDIDLEEITLRDGDAVFTIPAHTREGLRIERYIPEENCYSTHLEVAHFFYGGHPPMIVKISIDDIKPYKLGEREKLYI